MKQIVVLAPVEDRSERAIALASALAERNGAKLTLVRVLERAVVEQTDARSLPGLERMRDLVLEAETASLRATADRLAERCGDVSVVVRWGVPWDVIVDQVDRLGADLVVKPAHGLTHKGRIFFGSTALHLFRKCPCPVWVVGDEGRLPDRVLAAVDPSVHGSRLEVARRILGSARRIAEWSRGDLEVASAWHAAGEDMLRGRVPSSELEAYIEDSRSRAQAGLQRILEEVEIDVAPEHVHLLEGSPREAIPEFASARSSSLIVLGTLGRSRVAGDLLGETAEMVLREVRCSVLTIPPPALDSSTPPDPSR